MVNKLQEDALAEEQLHGLVERPWVRQHVSPSHIPEVVLPMPTLIPHDLSNRILDRHSDLQEMSVGDIKKMLGLTSLQSQAEKRARRGSEESRSEEFLEGGTLVTKETTTYSVGQRQ